MSPAVVGQAGRYPVSSVVKLVEQEDGSYARTVLSQPRGRKRRRVSKRWRGLDKAIRRVSKAQYAASGEFLARHDRSNQRKRNGGLRDVSKNARKAQRKALKELRLV